MQGCMPVDAGAYRFIRFHNCSTCFVPRFHPAGRTDWPMHTGTPVHIRTSLFSDHCWPSCLHSGQAWWGMLLPLSAASCLPAWFSLLSLHTPWARRPSTPGEWPLTMPCVIPSHGTPIALWACDALFGLSGPSCASQRRQAGACGIQIWLWMTSKKVGILQWQDNNGRDRASHSIDCGTHSEFQQSTAPLSALTELVWHWETWS